MSSRRGLRLCLLVGVAAGASAQAPLVPLLWLETVTPGRGDDGEAKGKNRLPVLRAIAAGDARIEQAEKLVDNEPARCMRELVARVWSKSGLPATWPTPRLPILLEKDGNFARHGFELQVDKAIEAHADVPYIVLALDAGSLSDTFLHEGGHLLHDVVTAGKKPVPWWSPFPHTTFAVTDPLTALAEGFAIHLEAMLGHYTDDGPRRAFYHRLTPRFDDRGTRQAEYFAPIADLMTYSQSWARYTGVRDEWAVFGGNDYDYLRSQFEPSRNRAELKPANAMIASEGVVAAVLFWTAVGLAEADGAKPGGGLQQPAILAAEEVLLGALAAAADGDAAAFRPDLLDVVAHVGADKSPARRLAAVRAVEITRGVTADASVRPAWREFYGAAVALDQRASAAAFKAMEARRIALQDAAVADAASLRAAVGPVVPVRAPAVLLAIVAFGEPFALEFDLNAATALEWRALKVEAATMARILAARDSKPFASLADFEQRAGVTAKAVGLETVDR
jgi:hypothetical protein